MANPYQSNPYQSANPWEGPASWLRDVAEASGRKASRFGARSYPGMQAPIEDAPRGVVEDPEAFYRRPAPVDLEREAFQQFAMAPGEGVRLSDAPKVAARPTAPMIEDDDPVGVAAKPSGGGRVDVTIDGKTYSYGGGQRGGANGPAPVLDAHNVEEGKLHSGVSGGFGGELRRMGRGPLDIASTGGAGELGEGGTSGMVGLSKDSTTPMANQLREEDRRRALHEIQFANRMRLEEQLAKDPLYREREMAKIKSEADSSVATNAATAQTMAYMRTLKMQETQKAEQRAMESLAKAEEQYAKDPAALEMARTRIEQVLSERKRNIEAQ